MSMPFCCAKAEFDGGSRNLASRGAFPSNPPRMTSLRQLLLAILLATSAQAENRVFVSLVGTLLEAEVASVNGEDAALKRASDGQILVVKLHTLCKEDNAYITRWMELNQGAATSAPMVAPATTAPAGKPQTYSLSCQPLPSKSNRGPADGGLRTVELSYTFNLSNREVRRDLKDAAGVVITVAKDAAAPAGNLIILQKEHFDVAIPAQSKMVYTTQPVRLLYSQGTGSTFGVKSQGYVLIISDAAGNILFTEASPDTGAKFTKEILEIKAVPCIVDREFKAATGDLPMNYISF